MEKSPATFFGKVGPFPFSVTTEVPEVAEWLAADYRAVDVATDGALAVFVRHDTELRPGPAIGLVSARSVWNPWGERNRARFFGGVEVDYRFTQSWALIRGADPALIYEALEFVLAAYLGEAGDDAGLHRAHGLGIRLNGLGHLFLGRSGVGKSRMGKELLEHESISLFSDDTPWVDSKGRLHAYPHRLSFKTMHDAATDAEPEPRAHTRPRYGDRFFVGPDRELARWAEPAKLASITLLRRSRRPRISPVGRWRTFAWLLRWLVLGLETPQIAELRLRTGRLSFGMGLKALVSRLRTAWSLAKEVPGYVLAFPDGERASRAWLESLEVKVEHRVREIGVLAP